MNLKQENQEDYSGSHFLYSSTAQAGDKRSLLYNDKYVVYYYLST
jgi:hypothetical protein